jgi:predicted porin
MLQNYKLKAMTLATIAACGLAPAAQAQTNVTVYGKMYPSLNRVDLTGATARGTPVSTLIAAPVGGADITQTALEAPNSRLGFRGSENLGGNLKAIFQLEMGFGIDTGTGSSPSQLFSRNSFVGLAGDFGTISLGNIDTVYKTVGDTLTFLGLSSGNFMSTSNILSKPGIGTSSASSFHLRRTNSVIYETPNVAGFTGMFDYSLGEAADDVKRGSVFSTAVTYQGGPIYAAVAYERHWDLFGGSRNVATALRNDSNVNAHSRDDAVRVTAQYQFPIGTKVEVNVARLRYTETGGAAGRFQDYRHKAWSLAAEHKMGATTLVGSYGQGDAGSCSLVGNAACNTRGLAGKMANVGIGYNLSRRTMLFAVASYMGNDESATYNNWLAGSPLPGQDIRTLSAGLSHSF